MSKPTMKLLKKGAIAIVVCLMSMGLYGQTAEFKDAFHRIEIEQPSRALKILDILSGREETNPNDQYHIGLAYIRLGFIDKALENFEKGIALKEKYGLNYAGKAYVYMLQGNDEESARLSQKALDLSREKDPDVLRAVAAVYLADSSNVPGAITLLTKARNLDRNDREIPMLLGDAYLILNKGGESVTSFEWAAKADPTWAKPHYKIALVYDRSKNHNMVLESLNKAIATDTMFAPAYRKLGELYYLRKEADNAVKAYEKYLAITEKPGDAKYQYAFFLIMAREFEKANKIFEDVVHSKDVPPIALKYYAFSLLEQDTAKANAQQARPLLEKYLSKMKPGEIQASDYAYYGKLLSKLDEDSLASEYLSKSLSIDSTQVDVLKLHAGNLLRNRRFAEAADVYTKLIKLDESPALQDLWYLGQAYYFDEQYVNADSTFNKIFAKQKIEKLPFQVILFSARSKANIDSTMTSGLAKPMYEILVQRISTNLGKFEKEAIEAYTYLGAYYIHKEENVGKAKSYYEKILELDAENSTAREFMDTIKPDSQKGG